MRFMKRLPFGQSLLQVVGVSGLALMSAGWSKPLHMTTDARERRELLEQSPAINALYDAQLPADSGRRSIDLDLSDDKQYNFLASRLKAAGKNEKTAPELFRKMAQVRARALARKNNPSPSSTQSLSGNQGLWCDHYLTVKPPVAGANPGTMVYEPYVRVSCKGGATYVYADIVAYDVNETETQSKEVAAEAGEEYGSGTDFIGVGAVAVVNTADKHLLRLESVAVAVDDLTGRDTSTYTVERTSLALREDGVFKLLHPQKILQSTQAEIKMCQYRGGADCDYAIAGYSQGTLVAYPPAPQGVAASKANAPGVLNPSDYWQLNAPYSQQRLYVPIRTEIKAGARNYLQCTVDSYTYAGVKLHPEDGGTCYNSVELNKLPVGSYSAVFNYLADTTYDLNESNPNGCPLNRILHKATTFTITIIGVAKCPKADGTYSLEKFVRGQAVDGRALTTKKLFFYNSCMAEGTHIQMENGVVTPVEQVKLGDKVIAGADGKVLTVTDVIRGNEASPFVQLRDNKGHQVTLTEMHPMITGQGKVVAARDLKVRDQVRTDKGIASLVSVKRVPVNGKRVFNLKLGTDAELAGVDSQGRTLFAEGFLVGDSAMQQELERPVKQPADVLASLPKAWRQDFLNAQSK